MNREGKFRALAGIEDRFIAESVRYAPEDAVCPSERIAHMKKKRVITFALAAVLILSLGIAAYAVGFFSMNRRVPEKSETFRINWEENPSGYIDWSNAKLAVTFPETAESREIEFRPGWLPFTLPSTLAGSSPWENLDADTWFRRLTAEQLPLSGSPAFVPEYEGMSQPLLIESYSMSQFSNGGALLLLYFTPGEIVEEHWDEPDVDVMRFHCTQHFDAVPEYSMPERTLGQNILLLSNADAGWVIRICGEISMDELIRVAKNLEIRETGRVLTCDDFENHFCFFDGGVG